MGRIRVKYLSIFYDRTHKKEEKIEFNGNFTVGDLVNRLSRTYGPRFKDAVLEERDQLKPHVWVSVNRKQVKELKTKLEDGDVVAFSLPVAGG